MKDKYLECLDQMELVNTIFNLITGLINPKQWKN